MRESRGFTMDRRNISKDFTFIVRSEEFVNDEYRQILPGTNTLIYLDDQLVHKEVMRIFGGIFPMVFQFAVNEDEYVYLYPATLSGEQLNWKEWKIKITYDIPDDNGQSKGSGGGDTGPSNGEDNSKEFTQVSFNSSHRMETQTVGCLIEAQRAVGQAGSPPYTPQESRFMGLTDDGVEGAEVPVREFTFQITQYMSPQKFNYEFMRKISRLTTCLNRFTFFGFAPTSVMMTGGNASGHLYQNIPVTMEFAVRPNFKYSRTQQTELCPVQDIYIPAPFGRRRVNVLQQYSVYNEPEFPDTAVIHTGGTRIPSGILPNGVHSGWSIINYLYAPKVSTEGKRLIRVPTDRLIFVPKDLMIVDFGLLDL
jgi:hypothetical protein